MKIEIMEDSNRDNFIVRVNAFIKDKNIIDIKYSKTEVHVSCTIYIKYSAMIIYKG